MAKKKRHHQTNRKQSTQRGVDDTKFYVKFKDPRIKSQIFYYFSEEDIFDPCIPLNDGDIIHDSKLISLDTAPPDLILQKQVKKVKKVAPIPKAQPKPKTQPKLKVQPKPKAKPRRVQHEETFQVADEDLVDDSDSELDSDVLDDSFEDSVEGNDLAYMTAMDIQIVGTSDNNIPLGKVEEEEELEELVELVQPKEDPNANRFKLDTALEPTKTTPELLSAVSLSKNEFDKNTKENDVNSYKVWKEEHLEKNTLVARQISMTEFRLLKKVVGLKKK